MRLVLAAALLLAAVPALAQDQSPARAGGRDAAAHRDSPAASHRDAMIADVEEAWVRPPVDEGTAVSHGTATVHGQRIPYTATAGTLTIRDDDGKPTASIFYTA